MTDAIQLDAALHWLKAVGSSKAMGEEVQGHARTLLDAFALPRDEPASPRVSTSDEKDAVAWLDHMAARTSPGHGAEKAARTLKAMLQRPVMPEEPTPEMLSAMLEAYIQHKTNVYQWREVYRALYSHLSAPTPTPAAKTVWRANWENDEGDGESDDLHTEADALRTAGEYHRRNPRCAVWITSYQVEA